MRSLRSGLLAVAALCFLAGSAAATDDVTYTYDALGRLIRVEYAGGSSVVYNYDAAGNRTSVVYGGTNVAPVATADSQATTIRRTIIFDPRQNDSDADSDPLTISQINTPTAAQHGTVTNDGAGQTLTYAPESTFPTGASGTDTFSYKITDGHGHTVTSSVTVTVTDRPPVAVADTVGVTHDVMKSFQPMGNDSDPDSDTLTITVPNGTPFELPSHATIERAGQNIKYTPYSGFTGTDTFQYTISDGHGNTSTATETMIVGAANQAPTAVADSGQYTATAAPGHPVTPSITLDPRANDTDPDGDTLSVTAVTQPQSPNASVTFTASSVTYHYNQAVSFLDLSDSFTYTISDGQGHTATATVSVSLYVETGT